MHIYKSSKYEREMVLAVLYRVQVAKAMTPVKENVITKKRTKSNIHVLELNLRD